MTLVKGAPKKSFAQKTDFLGLDLDLCPSKFYATHRNYEILQHHWSLIGNVVDSH
jgi:hypothetical protein